MNRPDMERIASAHDTKAAKIRALNEAGASTTDISTFLGIRYQHTYNVLLRAGRINREPLPEEPAAVTRLEVRPDGSMILSADIMDALALQNGGDLFVRTTDKGLLLMPKDVAIAEIERAAANRMPEHASLLSTLLRD